MKKISVIVFVSLLLATASIFIFGAVQALDTTTPISLTTLSQHNSSTDCWTALNGKVYNLTSYISEHPGGSAIEAICGIDGTAIMSSQHPEAYINLISNLQIGVLATPDLTPPVITILGDNPVSVNIGDNYTDAGATANDNVDGDLTSEMITVNGVDTSVAGNYTVTYTVWDAAGNSAQAIRTAIVNDIPVENTNQTNTTDNEVENDLDDDETEVDDNETEVDDDNETEVDDNETEVDDDNETEVDDHNESSTHNESHQESSVNQESHQESSTHEETHLEDSETEDEEHHSESSINHEEDQHYEDNEDNEDD